MRNSLQSIQSSRSIMRAPVALTALMLLVGANAVDAQVTYRIGDVAAQPGESDVVVPLSIEINSDEIVDGWQMFVGVDLSILEGVVITGTREADFYSFIGASGFFTPDAIGAATVYSFRNDASKELSSANDGIVAELHMCISSDAEPGTYSLSFLDSVEREVGTQRNEVAIDGQSVDVAVEGGTLTIAGDPLVEACSLPGPGTVGTPPVRGVLVDVGSTAADPGASDVTVPITLDSQAGEDFGLLGWSVVLSYDPAALASLTIDPEGDPEFFLLRDQDGFLDPGFVGATASFSADEGEALPPPSGTLANLSFCVLPTAEAGSTSIQVKASVRIKDGERASFDRMRTSVDFESGSGDPVHVESPGRGGGTVQISGAPVAGECEPDEFTPPLPPLGFELAYLLDGPQTPVAPGGAVDVDFSLVSSHPVQGFQVAIEWVEDDLDFVDVVFDDTFYSDTAFQSHLEGPDALVFAGIFDLARGQALLPPNTTDPINTMTFIVSPAIQNETTTIGFASRITAERLGLNNGNAFDNLAVVNAEAIDPELSELSISFDTSNDLVLNVAPDVTLFTRGDSNRDGVVDVSDPGFTLAQLFLGGPETTCEDAADANDDGKVDVSDPIRTLGRLFLGAPPLPPPSPLPGSDPTVDTLECAPPFTNN